VRVAFNAQSSDRIKPLRGVNKGVLSYPKYGVDQPGQRPSMICDFTRLYQAAGVTSVRTHDDVFDVANALRGSGSFVSGVEFAESAPLPTNPQDLANVNDAVDAILDESNGYVFSTSALNNRLRFNNLDHLAVFGAFDAWLSWYPSSGEAVASPDNYWLGDDTTGIRRSYLALADGGFEIYYRIGESFHGPSFMGTASPLLLQGAPDVSTPRSRYATAAATMLQLLLEPGEPDVPAGDLPGFIEIWNEPNGAGYMGPYAKWDPTDDPQWARWAGDYRGMVDALDLTLGGVAPAGGFAFNRSGLELFIQSMEGLQPSKVFSFLKDVPLAGMPFVSFHWYHTDATADEPLTPQTMKLADDLVALRGAVDRLATFQQHLAHLLDLDLLPGPPGLVEAQPSVHGPPLHITEWNFRTQADDALEFPGSGLWGAFASAGQTWMQHPSLDVERAHFWDGHYVAGTAKQDGGDGGVGLFSALEDDGGIRFAVHASALTMSLHDGLDGDAWIPVVLERTRMVPFWQDTYTSVLDAAADRAEVTAQTSRSLDGQRSTVILTNLAPGARDVSVEVSGFAGDPDGYTTAWITEFDPGNFPVEGIRVEGYPSGGLFVPEEGQVESAFSDSLQRYPMSVNVVSKDPTAPAAAVIPLTVPGYGVVRIDIQPVNIEAIPSGAGRVEGEGD